MALLTGEACVELKQKIDGMMMAACAVQGVLSMTWLRLAEQVQTRNCSLTYGSAGDVHHVVDNRTYSCLTNQPNLALSSCLPTPCSSYLRVCATRIL